MLTIKQPAPMSTVDRSFLETYPILSLCFLALIVAFNVSRAQCSSLLHSDRSSSSSPFSPVDHSGNSQISKEPPQPLRHLELRNTTATNPLQLPGGSFATFVVENAEQQKLAPKVNLSLTSDLSQSVLVDLSKSSLATNRNLSSSLPTISRIHKRNKLKFEATPSLLDSMTEEDLDKQRMAVRHKFTFMVNGKELALKPPPPPPTSRAAESSSSALVVGVNELPDNNITTTITKGSSDKAGEAKKVNRFGDSFMSSDYESGFDVSESESHPSKQHPPPLDSPVTSKSRSRRRQNSGSKLAPSSSSSSLMSASNSDTNRSNNSDGDDDDEDADGDNDEPQSATLVLSAEIGDNAFSSGGGKSTQSRNQLQQAKNRGSSNVISQDWSKSAAIGGGGGGGKQAGKQGEQHFGKTKSYGGSSRFSTLLSGSATSRSNDSANQSGDQKHWDTTTKYSSMNNNPSNALANSKTPFPLETSAASVPNDNESGYSKASLKKNQYPKAPVSARARYTSSAAQSSSQQQAIASGGSGGSNGNAQGSSRAAGARHRNEPSSYDAAAAAADDVIGGGANNHDDDKHSSPLIAGGLVAIPRLPQQSSLTRLARFDKSTNGSVNLITTSSSPSSSQSAAAAAQQVKTADYNLVSGRHSPPTTSDYLTSEYRTNFSNDYTSTSSGRLSGSPINSGGELTITKAPIVQRDLTFNRLLPLTTSTSGLNNLQQQPPTGSPFFNDLSRSRASRSGRPGVGPMFEGISGDRGVFTQKEAAFINNNYNNSNNNNNSYDNTVHGIKPRGFGPFGQPTFPEVNRSSPIEKMASSSSSILGRTGPILPNPFASHQQQLRALVPAAVALLAQAQEDQQVRAANQIRAMLTAQQQFPPSLPVAPSGGFDQFLHSSRAASSTGYPLNQNLSNAAEQMIATSNHLGVSHLGPQSLNPVSAGLGVSESNSYNSIANFHDYPDRPLGGSGGSPTGSGGDSSLHSGIDSPLGSSSSASSSATTMSSILSDDRRGSNDYDGSGYETTSPTMRGSQGSSGPSTGGDQVTNSRSSMSDIYFRSEGGGGGGGHKSSRDAGSASSGSYPARNSIDPYEDSSSGISTSEYERDLADMDEEFNRATYRRPPPSVNQIASDSYMNMSPDRYSDGARRYTRRPPSYSDFASDYMQATHGPPVSSMIPTRAYHQRNPLTWASAGPAGYSESADLWSETGAEYSPLASYMNPSQYSLHPGWKPRYQRTYSAAAAAAPYLATAASEQPHHIQPAAYNFIPSHHHHYSSAMPTETVSIALSPLAAAAAAAASALAAADKSRHPSGGAGWLTLPRIAANSLTAPAAVSAAASNAHATTLPAAFQAYYHHHPAARPGPYALSSVPIYAIAQRPNTPLAAAASAAAPSYIPYYHSAGPAIFAYRPTGVLPTTQLLTAASFAYPLRIPVGPMGRPSPLSLGPPPRSIGLRPFYSDLQFAESKFKSNLTNSASSSDNNNNNNNNNKGLSKTGGSLTAMAKNLTRKMFGSASQMRPQHVAPPNPLYDLFAHNQNSTTNLSSQIVL